MVSAYESIQILKRSVSLSKLDCVLSTEFSALPLSSQANWNKNPNGDNFLMDLFKLFF